MKQVIQSPIVQDTKKRYEQVFVTEPKLRYQPPRITVYGSVSTHTRGSGGDFEDECTSGKQPGEDE